MPRRFNHNLLLENIENNDTATKEKITFYSNSILIATHCEPIVLLPMTGHTLEISYHKTTHWKFHITRSHTGNLISQDHTLSIPTISSHMELSILH